MDKVTGLSENIRRCIGTLQSSFGLDRCLLDNTFPFVIRTNCEVGAEPSRFTLTLTVTTGDEFGPCPPIPLRHVLYIDEVGQKQLYSNPCSLTCSHVVGGSAQPRTEPSAGRYLRIDKDGLIPKGSSTKIMVNSAFHSSGPYQGNRA
jgi:hypothetical protein